MKPKPNPGLARPRSQNQGKSRLIKAEAPNSKLQASDEHPNSVTKHYYQVTYGFALGMSLAFGVGRLWLCTLPFRCPKIDIPAGFWLNYAVAA
jgi:hypothetical protein